MRSVYEFGPFRLDSDEGLLLRNGEPVRLTPKTFEMLRVLVENRGRLLHKTQLLQLVWPDSFVDEGNLSHHVFSLRKALADERGSTTYIETVPKRGYRFVGEVREVAVRDPREPSSSSSIVAWDTSISDTYFSAAKRIDSLAVLPLANKSESAEQDYLADGMTEALISDLARIKTLRVISRTSAMRYKGTQKTLPDIAQELNVDGVVAGSVLRTGNCVRLSVELIQAPTDAHLWAHSYDGNVNDLIALQREVARAIAEKIRATPASQRDLLGRGRPVEPRSHEAYLKGRYYYGQATEEGFWKAVEHLRIAIDMDPDFALARIAFADAHVALAALGASTPRESFSYAKTEAFAALHIDDSLADGHRVLGLLRMFGDWDWPGAETAFRRALELNTGSAETHWQYALCLVARGRWAEGIAEAERARVLDPLSLMINNDLAFALWAARRYDDAIIQYCRTLELDSHFLESRRELGLIYAHIGNIPAALHELRKAADLGSETETRAFLGYTLARAGRPDEARRLLTELRQRSERQYVSPTARALIEMGLGDHDAALDSLESACESRCPWLSFLQAWPVFDPLQSDRRFQDLLRRIGLSGDEPGDSESQRLVS